MSKESLVWAEIFCKSWTCFTFLSRRGFIQFFLCLPCACRIFASEINRQKGGTSAISRRTAHSCVRMRISAWLRNNALDCGITRNNAYCFCALLRDFCERIGVKNKSHYCALSRIVARYRAFSRVSSCH
eukprot:Pompholyxophrys_punicea_v1_NODE_126_length_3319_cov_18.116115.p3 type:complete len:129 gc:universal NODE_126_length_3319_cov_18.116115:2875-3261(+)